MKEIINQEIEIAYRKRNIMNQQQAKLMAFCILTGIILLSAFVGAAIQKYIIGC